MLHIVFGKQARIFIGTEPKDYVRIGESYGS